MSNGNVLGPVSFLIYINDSPMCRIKMFANDIKCFSRKNFLADVDAFQQNIHKLML